MAKQTAEQLRPRLSMDYKIASKMRSPLMNVTAYRNADDLEMRRNPIESEDEGGQATHYLVDYYMRTLVGPDEYSDKTSVMFDLLANGNYPYSWPGCFVASSPMPWTPHFKAGMPICIDHDLWKDANGRMLLGELLIHVAKLLNFDEIPRGENYGGLNPPAAAYWRDKLERRPLNPDFLYPVLSAVLDELTPFTAIVRDSSEDFSAITPSRDEMFSPGSVIEQSAQAAVDEEMFTAMPERIA